jgi:hypothetical protein
MWALQNRTPYGAERTWIRDKSGRHYWVVAVKATFDVSTAGVVRLAGEQTPPALAPEYAGPPGGSSLRWDTDLLYVKPCTDVVAEAYAHAGGKARPVVPVSLRVGPIHKELTVYGDRVYSRRLHEVVPSAPEPFERRPICYESAFGGEDLSDPDSKKHRIFERNPIGKGFAVHRSSLINQPAHTIESSGGHEPAGFGPINPAWSPRRELAGTFDDAWARCKKPLLPDNYDALHGSCAPADQRVIEYLRGGEPVELLGLTPGVDLLRFVLPKIYLTYSTRFGSRTEEHRGRLATVLLLPEQGQVALVWQTALYVAPRETDYLDHTVIAEKPYRI